MLSKNEIKYIQSLGHKKSRDQDRVFLTEGVKLTCEVLKQVPDQLIRLYATATYLDHAGQGIPQDKIIEVNEVELQRISQLQTPNQVLAIVKQSEPVKPSQIDADWVLALDAIRDPGNMGTIIRLADWFGIKCIVCSPDCAEFYNPKVVQASMGSILRVGYCEHDLLAYLQRQSRPVIAATLDGQNLSGFQFPQTGVLVIGNEAKGIDAGLLKIITHQVSIPSFGLAESLNAAVATGILLWELKRN